MAFTQVDTAPRLTWFPQSSFLPIWPFLASPSLDLTDRLDLFSTIFSTSHAYPIVWPREASLIWRRVRVVNTETHAPYHDVYARLCFAPNPFRLLESDI